jgi:hypothetical protein
VKDGCCCGAVDVSVCTVTMRSELRRNLQHCGASDNLAVGSSLALVLFRDELFLDMTWSGRNVVPHVALYADGRVTKGKKKCLDEETSMKKDTYL